MSDVIHQFYYMVCHVCCDFKVLVILIFCMLSPSDHCDCHMTFFSLCNALFFLSAIFSPSSLTVMHLHSMILVNAKLCGINPG